MKVGLDLEMWIEEKYEEWRKKPLYNPYGLDKNDNWIPKCFALFIANELQYASPKQDAPSK